jgi:Cu/Ag efflux protein CusF
MKPSLLKSALVAVAGLALCAPVALQAQTPTDTDAAMSAASSKMKKTEYKGVVKAIDATTITVTTKKGDLTLTLDDKTIVQVSKKKAAITDITVGEKVTGSYTKDAGGTMLACKVNGHPGKMAAAPAMPATNAAPTNP